MVGSGTSHTVGPPGPEGERPLENHFGAEYLESVDARAFGGRTLVNQSCHMNFETGLIDCEWHVLVIDL